MTYVPRAGWGARSPQGPRNALDRSPKGVGVHWNGPGCAAQIRTHDKCPGFIRGIQSFHMGPQRGWSDIAYSLFICPHGDVYEGRGKGVGTAAFGSNHGNRYYYALYAMWGEGDGPVPDALLDGLRDAVRICRGWGAGNQIIGHRDEQNTQCPGDELYSYVKTGRLEPGSKTPPKDWVDMASESDIRKIIREELAKVPAAVWAEKVTLNNADREALGGSKLKEISTAGLLKTGVRLQARQSTADAVLREISE